MPLLKSRVVKNPILRRSETANLPFWKVDAWLFHLFFGKRPKTIADFGSRRGDNTGGDAYSQFLHSSLHS